MAEIVGFYLCWIRLGEERGSIPVDVSQRLRFSLFVDPVKFDERFGSRFNGPEGAAGDEGEGDGEEEEEEDGESPEARPPAAAAAAPTGGMLHPRLIDRMRRSAADAARAFLAFESTHATSDDRIRAAMVRGRHSHAGAERPCEPPQCH